MKGYLKAVAVATMVAVPMMASAKSKRVYVEYSGYAPCATACAPACAPAPRCAPACAPACSPCGGYGYGFNPFSIVGGVVNGVGAFVGNVGSGVAGTFGCCY